MGRVKPSTMREGVKVQKGSGIPFFKWDMGKKYKVVFPTVADEKDVFAYMESVHQIMINGKFAKIRCTNESYQVSDESKAAVVKYDEATGELAVDKSSGRVLNDGTCPLCELEHLYRGYVFHEVEKWKGENPDASDKEISAEYKKLFDKSPVQASAKRNKEGELKISTTNILLGLVYHLDEKNQYIVDKEGAPVFDVQVFDFSDSRYDKLISTAENNRDYMSEKLKEITDDFGLAWSEFIFDFPVREEKAQSGKDLTIAIVPSGHSAIEKYDGLLGKITGELEDVEKVEGIFENLPALRVRSIPEIEKELQGKLTQYRAYMSDVEKSELDESLSADEKYLSNDEAEALLNEDLNGGSDAPVTSNESGEDEFLA